MNPLHMDRPIGTGAEGARTSDTHLYGHWLVIARLLWFAVVGLVIGIVIASIPTYITFLHTLTTNGSMQIQLTPRGVLALHALGLSIDSYAIFNVTINALFVFGFVLVGAVIFWRKADDRLALFTSAALVAFPIGFISTQTTTLPSPCLLLVQVVSFFTGSSLSLFFYLFPNGRFVPPWTRWLMIGWILYEGSERFFPASPFNPLAHVPALNHGFFFALLASIVAAQIYRYRRVSTPRERHQTRWVVFGCTIGILGLIGSVIFSLLAPFENGTLTFFLFYPTLLLSVLCIPISIGIAILRSRLWDIDIIINRTLVYSLLTLGIVGLYVLVVVSLGTLFQAQGNLVLALLATGLIAFLFQPLRLRLQQGVNRLMYGERDDPYTLLSRFGQRLETTLAPDAVLPTIVQTVAQALKLPYVALLLKEKDAFTTAASCGELRGEPLAVPLIYQGETIGTLLLAPRTPGEMFALADTRVFGELARQISLATHAVRLTADLQRANAHLVAARARVVTAHEEERRRLRRDLHDGLGPTLAALTLKIGAARTLLPRDQAAADTVLRGLGSDIETTVNDIRRLVSNLRPPSLDELGLLGAIREHVLQQTLALGVDQGDELRMTMEAPDALPPLPAAVEVAAFRIVQEALTNVVRHAHAQTCSIRLELDTMLSVEICDNGTGFLAEQHAGVGIRSMNERASELGGTCIVESVPTGGTCVLAQLPIPKE
ncbi:MAG: histidine kinase [Chloroflexota bacterium]|nr:histidine kinase [Chloroflexota bacterium]